MYSLDSIVLDFAVTLHEGKAPQVLWIPPHPHSQSSALHAIPHISAEGPDMAFAGVEVGGKNRNQVERWKI